VLRLKSFELGGGKAGNCFKPGAQKSPLRRGNLSDTEDDASGKTRCAQIPPKERKEANERS